MAQDGNSVITFPEGTRSDNGRLLPFKRGPFKSGTPSLAHSAIACLRSSWRTRARKGRVREDREELRGEVCGGAPFFFMGDRYRYRHRYR